MEEDEGMLNFSQEKEKDRGHMTRTKPPNFLAFDSTKDRKRDESENGLDFSLAKIALDDEKDCKDIKSHW